MAEHEDSAPDTEWLTLTVSYRKEKYDFKFPADATIADLFTEIEASLEVPALNQKILAPKCPLLKHPPKNPDMLLQELKGKPLTLMGSPVADIQAVDIMAERVVRRNLARMARMSIRPKKNTRVIPHDSQYTFLQVRSLNTLPFGPSSKRLLMQLKEDPGIVAAMKKHKMTVSLLTELDPTTHTQVTHEGTTRILGLNRNKGEVIELRLRTDRIDGYRDYKTIRKTLCHELAHNVYSAHDRDFWDLCHQIERDVEAGDWRSRGHTIGEPSRAQEEEDHQDEGGWTGGEFILGGLKNPDEMMNRREILAQAAIERQKKQTEAETELVSGKRKNEKK